MKYTSITFFPGYFKVQVRACITGALLVVCVYYCDLLFLVSLIIDKKL